MRRSLRLAVIGLLVIAAAVVARVAIERSIQPPPPLPEDLVHLDPDLAEMIREAAARVARDRSNAAAWRELGAIYHANALLHLAEPCYDTALTLDPRDRPTWYRLALVRHSLGEVEASIAILQPLTKAAPDYGPLHLRLGNWLLDLDRLDLAAESFERLAEIEPAHPGAKIGLARLHLRRNEPERAVVLLEDILRRRGSVAINPPLEEYVNHLLGQALLRLGREDEASLALARSQQLRGAKLSWPDPWEQEIAAYSANVYSKFEHIQHLQQQGQHQRAVEMLTKLRQRSPDHLAIALRLADAHRQAQQYEASLEVLRQVQALQPNLPQVHLQLAQTYVEIGERGRPAHAEQWRARAMEHIDIALALNPALPPAHAQKGDLLLRKGDVDAAIEVFDHARRVCGDDAFWIMRTGEAQYAAERWEDAARSFEQVTLLLPGLAQGWRLLGQTRWRLGEFDASRAALREARRLAPNDHDIAAALNEVQNVDVLMQRPSTADQP